MNSSRRGLLWLFAIVLGLGTPLRAQEADRYWAWGWGAYGGSVPDTARYDWSMVNFGNVGATQEAADRWNEILRLNPRHKIVIRVWPIMGKGDCKENRFQATFLHYLYKEGVKAKLLDETRRQIRLMLDGLTRPENVVGMTFLEELPGHFSSAPWRNPKPGDPLPWDIARFAKEIEAELGAPFDMLNEEHRLWWGRKYTGVLEEIHRTMKDAGEGRLVMHYQATGWSTLDHLQPGETLFRRNTNPIRYSQILKPGVCDGIFGYPNNEKIWKNQTLAMADKYHCPFFSQVSSPAGMRLSKYEDVVKMARTEHPGNLGSFMYCSGGRGARAWNELPWMDGERYWTNNDISRRVAWEYGIGLDVVERYLVPRIALDFDGAGKREGDFFHVWAQVYNPRDASWYGGQDEKAWMGKVKVTLEVPDGFTLPVRNSPPATLTIGPIPPRQARTADWWAQVTGDGALPAGQAFRLRAVTEDGASVETAAEGLNPQIASFGEREIFRSGDTWVEPGFRLKPFEQALELMPQGVDIVFPEFASGGNSVVYRDVLPSDARLVIGPGHRATLFGASLFDESARTFAKEAGAAGHAVFAERYSPYGSPRVRVRSNARYTFRVRGSVDGGCVFHAIALFFDAKDPAKKLPQKSCFFNKLTAKPQTVETVIETPAFGASEGFAQLRFYRHNKQGTLKLESYDLFRADAPPAGTDVSGKLEGVLPVLGRPLSVWTFKDRADPSRYGRPKLRLRFFNPAEEAAELAEKRQGATDF